MMQLSNMELAEKALQTRKDIIMMLMHARSGHAAGALGLADIFTFLYFEYLKHDPKRPEWSKRDYFLVSNGHVAPVWYSVLARTGYFHPEKLAELRKLGSMLQGHPWNIKTPGIFNSSGALGQGGSQAVGVALGLRLDKRPNRVFCVLSDAEHNEGQTWEAIMLAAKHKLSNLTFIIDRNNVQIGGTTRDIMPLDDEVTKDDELVGKYNYFLWDTIEIDGHNFDQIRTALDKAGESDRPTAVIAHTVAGKGVSFMEGKFEYHDWRGENEIAVKALAELSHSSKQLKR